MANVKIIRAAHFFLTTFRKPEKVIGHLSHIRRLDLLHGGPMKGLVGLAIPRSFRVTYY